MKDRTKPLHLLCVCTWYLPEGQKGCNCKKMQELCEIPRTEKPPPGGTR